MTNSVNEEITLDVQEIGATIVFDPIMDSNWKEVHSG